MQTDIDLLIVGSGSLARTISYCIPLLTKKKLKIVITSRSFEAANEMATIGNARAKLLDSRVSFSSQKIDWENIDSLKENFLKLHVKIVLLASSLQSPWELTQNESEWALLIKHAGFGVTLPLQAYLAVKLGCFFKEYNFSGLFINACYPDAVNPLLKALDLNIFCGIGNISIISTSVEVSLNVASHDNLKILAHHFHVGLETPNQKKYPIVAYLNEKSIAASNCLYSTIQYIKGSELNHITGCTAAKMLVALFSKKLTKCHAPGPYGLPGGYPIIVGNFNIELDLPKHITLKEAILKNREWALLDGVLVEDKMVVFGDNASRILDKYDFQYAEGFKIFDIYKVCNELLYLRKELSTK